MLTQTKFYKSELYPSDTVYVEDTPENRLRLTELIGPYYSGFGGSSGIISVDILNETWYPCYAHKWLYRDIPPMFNLNTL